MLVDDSWYVLLSGLKADTDAQIAVDSTYDFIVIDGYVYYAELVTGGDAKIAMVTGVTNNTNFDGDVLVRLLLADGSTVEAYAHQCGATGLSGITADALVAYTVSDDIYTLYIVGKNYPGSDALRAMAGYDNITTDLNSTTGVAAGSAFDQTKSQPTIDNRRINDNAVVFVKYDSKPSTVAMDAEYMVVSGADVNDWSSDWGANGVGLYKNSGLGYLDVAVLIGQAKVATPGTSTNYAYVTSGVSKGSDYVSYKIWDGSSEESVTVQEKVSVTQATEGGVISFDWDGDGVIKNVQAVGTAGAITYAGSSQVGIDNVGYKMADDIVILNVDTDAKSGVSGEAITEAKKDTNGLYYNNAKYVLNSDDEIELLVIDVKNDQWIGAGYMTVAYSVDKTSTATNIVLNVAEPLYKEDGTALDGGATPSKQLENTGSVSLTSMTYSATNKTLTIVVSGAGNGDTITSAATATLTNADGNKLNISLEFDGSNWVIK